MRWSILSRARADGIIITQALNTTLFLDYLTRSHLPWNQSEIHKKPECTQLTSLFVFLIFSNTSSYGTSPLTTTFCCSRLTSYVIPAQHCQLPFHYHHNGHPTFHFRKCPLHGPGTPSTCHLKIMSFVPFSLGLVCRTLTSNSYSPYVTITDQHLSLDTRDAAYPRTIVVGVDCKQMIG